MKCVSDHHYHHRTCVVICFDMISVLTLCFSAEVLSSHPLVISSSMAVARATVASVVEASASQLPLRFPWKLSGNAIVVKQDWCWHAARRGHASRELESLTASPSHLALILRASKYHL